jgi:hypothetical protein
LTACSSRVSLAGACGPASFFGALAAMSVCELEKDGFERHLQELLAEQPG